MTNAPGVFDLRPRATDLGDSSKDITFHAPSGVLKPLAEAIGVDAVLTCEAEFRASPAGSGFDVKGRTKARVVQTCVVTLDPFETEINVPIEVRFAPDTGAGAQPAMSEDEEGSSGMAEVPELIVGGMLDLGAVLQEFLTLSVDPYPRKPGVTYEPANAEDDDRISPFAALAQLHSDDTKRKS